MSAIFAREFSRYNHNADAIRVAEDGICQETTLKINSLTWCLHETENFYFAYLFCVW
jgi:hypothetical protein